jgi:hypothetical protein
MEVPWQQINEEGIMKLTTHHLKRIVKEELRGVLAENHGNFISSLHSDPDIHLALFPHQKIGFKMKFANGCDVKFLFYERSQDPNSVILSLIESTCSGKGYGKQVMQRLVDLADSTGTTIELFASPSGNNPMSVDKLEDWYRKFNFKSFDDTPQRMIRTPVEKSASYS